MAKLNESTLGGYAIHDPPPGYGRPTNILQWRSGASRFGIGTFILRESDYDAMVGNSNFTGKVQLVLKGGPDASQNKLSINVRVCGHAVCGGGAGAVENAVEVIVQDARCEKITPLQKAYNVPQQPFSWVSSDYNYYSSTKNSGTPWTWAQVITDAGLPSLPANPSWKPRNIIFDNVALCRAIDEIAARLFIVAGWDGTSNTYCTPGVLNSTNSGLLSAAQSLAWVGGDAGDRDPLKLPATISCFFQANNTDPFTNRFYKKDITVGASSDPPAAGPTQALHLGDIPAIRSGSSWSNQSDMDAIAADMAARCYTWMNVGPAEYLFAGIWPFQLDGKIRHIEWITDKDGARTRIVMNNERAFSPLDDLAHSVVLPSNQLVIPLGNTFVSSHGGSGSKFVLGGGGSTIPLVKVTDKTFTPPGGGSLTLGVGVYAGYKWIAPVSNNPALTSNLTESMIGQQGSQIIIFNTSEVGQTDQTKRNIDVTIITEVPLIYPAVLVCTMDDGTEIWAIVDATWSDACVETNP